MDMPLRQTALIHIHVLDVDVVSQYDYMAVEDIPSSGVSEAVMPMF
jgi:hypothetical protein